MQISRVFEIVFTFIGLTESNDQADSAANRVDKFDADSHGSPGCRVDAAVLRENRYG